MFASVALAVLFLCSSAIAQTERKTWAVAIGVSKYPRLPGGQQLQFADRDAEDFAADIRRYGAGATEVRLLTGEQATAAAIKSAIGNWLAASSTENDDVVIFFSGHGLFERKYGESYFLAYDSDANDPFATAISVSDLANALTRRIRARRVVIIADAVRRDLFPPEEDGPADAASFAQSFDALASARQGLSILLASGPGEFSREGARWAGHGVFTRFLLDAMAGNADADQNGSTTVEEIYNFVAKRVPEDTSNKQHVWRAQSQLSEIVLARSQAIARAPQTTPRNRLPEPIKQPAQTPPATSPQPTQKQSEPIAALPKPESPKTEPPKTEMPKTATPKTESPKPEQPKTEPPKTATPKTEPSKPETPKIEPLKPEPRASQPTPKNETAARNRPAETTRKPEALPKPESPPARASETENKSNAEKRAPEAATAPRPKPVAPPATKPINMKPPDNAASVPEASAGVKTETLPPPPRPVVQPPRVAVNAAPPKDQPAPAPSSVTTAPTIAAPSPLILQLEAAIAEGALIEPRGNSAWDIYQRVGADQSAAAEVGRLKIKLADALEKGGLSIVSGDVRADNIADKVDDFKRAGQMLSRARSLRPENAAIVTLEKVSAAQALVALQFYDEAERALSSLQDAKIASVENALGLVYIGKLDNYRAERAFKRAIEIAPAWAAPHYNLALVYRNQKNDAALDELRTAAQLAPDNAEMSAALGDEYFSREQWQNAAETYRKAIAINPSDDALHTKLGHALFSMGLKDEANLEYKKANELRRKP
ncbi:MAG: tetratricopeptide repeat protein [Acidobacteriota bacterium]